MIAVQLDDLVRAAVEAPFDQCVAIRGNAGTGTTAALRQRSERARALAPDAAPLLALSSNDLIDTACLWLHNDGFTGAFIDDAAAAALFAEAAHSFLDLNWPELRDATIDPEVAGARSPKRFLASAFSLIQKLHDASIGPDEFLRCCLAGAADFCAKPPNFAHPKLLNDTKETYRDSINVAEVELQRQYRREVDLAKVLAKLYAEFLQLTNERCKFSRREALHVAARALSADPAKADSLRARVQYAFIDNAHDLRPSDLAFLRAVFGEELRGVTFAGDSQSATNTFRGARPDLVFGKAHETITLQRQHRSPLAIDLACRQLAGSFEKSAPGPIEPTLSLYRAKTLKNEADYVARSVAALLLNGAQPNEIALIFRSVADVQIFQTALLDLDIPAQMDGDYNCFTDRYALDALALLWNIWDPFRHEWLIRTLTGSFMALSDASLAVLSSEPADAQASLFIVEDEEPVIARSRRWDPKRDVRLGWNVLRGDCDGALNPTARDRVARFRRLRANWVSELESLPLGALLQRVWSEGLARDGTEHSARAITQERALGGLAHRLLQFAQGSPSATLGDVLNFAQRQAHALATDTCTSLVDERCVQILSVDATRGREFSHVILPNVAAGLFPRWYVPDAFLYSPKFGIVPKENAGDSRTSRTAKFTYYLHHSKARDLYNAQERRAFIYALRRATRTALVTTSGRATRGVTAPEFFEELRSAHLPGTLVSVD